MGSERGQDDERPMQRVHVAAFEMAMFPVTRGEYAHFLEATGHEAPRDWRDQSLVPGSLVPGSLVPGSLVPESLVPESLVPGSRVPGSRVPESLAGDDRPVTGVSWHD